MVTAINHHLETAIAVGVRFLENCRPSRRMSIREWAERHVVIPTGQRGLRGRPFRVDNNPWAGLWFDELDSGKWPMAVLVGPTQSGKTLCGLTIPTIRKAHHLREECVLAIPEGDMVDDKWQRDFLPVLKKSPALGWLIPHRGPGSRGGVVKDRVLLGNGVMLKMMTRGGKDTGKAGFTTPNVHMTEAAGWSHASEKSQESSPFWQVYGRLLGFKRHERSMIVEGTVTIADELPWSLKGEESENLLSTNSCIVKPCVHCGEWVAPGREHLRGWQETKSVIEAAEKAFWICPTCGEKISDEQRRTMNADSQLLHGEQKIDNRGEVIGDDPQTDTLFFHYSQFDNQLLDAADIAPEEWRAAQLSEGTQDHEDAEKRLCQQTWARPFKSKLAEAEPLKPEIVRKRTDTWPRNILPPDTKHLVIAGDCGKWKGWWAAFAARENGVIHVPAYGAFDVCMSDLDEIESRLRSSLNELIDGTFESGFDISGSTDRRLPETVWIDRGWLKNIVCEVVRGRGGISDNRYRAAKGFGRTTRVKHLYRRPTKRTKERLRIGNRWHADLDVVDRILKFNFDADYWKLRVHEALRIKKGVKGSITFFREDMPNEHGKLSNHLCAEQFRREWVLEKGYVDKWVKTGQNHWLDCFAEGFAALDYLGFRFVDYPDPPSEEEPTDEAPTESEKDNWYARMRRAA